MGTLTLTASSTIDYTAGGASSSLVFASSSGTWSIYTLSVYNWQAGIDLMRFGTNATGLDATQLSFISFYSDSGSTFLGNAMIDSSGYVNISPEPSTWALLTVALTVVVIFRRRSIRPRDKETSGR